MNEEEGEQDIEAERRAHHSALERRRRDHIKYTFGCLRDAVPSLQWERATRAQILKRATDYIQVMRRRNRERMHTIRDLRREKHHLEDQIPSLGERREAQWRWPLFAEFKRRLDQRGGRLRVARVLLSGTSTLTDGLLAAVGRSSTRQT
ncbi:hypothetical protein MRX96_054446 [Rhipicephalus microplus]